MTRKSAWTEEAWNDYLYWQGQDKKTLKRINKLIEAAIRSPFEGIGKPEALRDLNRVLVATNRLVYAVDDDYLTVISCRYPYFD